MPTRCASSAIESWHCFFVPDEQDRAAALGRRCGRRRTACCDQLERLLQVDDVDAAPLREDEAAHLGVPAAGLVAEVNSGLQKLAHGDDGHRISSSVLLGLGPAETGGTGHECPAPPPACSAGSGAEARGILADALRTLGRVHGVVRLSAWDLAVECVDEALASGAVPSLERLGRLGQLGSLPSFIAALGGRRRPGRRSTADFARERESLGLAPAEIAAELLVLGRVLERHGETEARGRRSTAASSAYVGPRHRRAGRAAPAATRSPGSSTTAPSTPSSRAEAARARRYRGRVALVLFDLDRFKETNDREGHQEGDRLLRAFASALAGDASRDRRRGPRRRRRVRRPPARRPGRPTWTRSSTGSAEPAARTALRQRRRRPPAGGVLRRRAAPRDGRPAPLLGQDCPRRVGARGFLEDALDRAGLVGRVLARPVGAGAALDDRLLHPVAGRR